MSWTRYLELIVLVNAQRRSPIATSLTNPNALDQVEVVSHDTFPVRLRFGELTGMSNSPINPVRLTAGSKIVLAGKPLQNLSSPDLLFFADDFEETAEGDETPTYYYESILNTNTSQVDIAIGALTGSNRILQALADIEVQSDDNSQRTTFQFQLNLKRQVYNGTEGQPEDANPPWPAPGEILTRSARFRIGSTGDPEYYVDALEKWVRVSMTGNPPQQTIVVLED